MIMCLYKFIFCNSASILNILHFLVFIFFTFCNFSNNYIVIFKYVNYVKLNLLSKNRNGGNVIVTCEIPVETALKPVNPKIVSFINIWGSLINI